MNIDIESRDCSICGGPIMFTYVHPDNDFYIENGKIERDRNNDIYSATHPYVEFRCVNDITHDIEHKTIADDPEDDSLMDWMIKVENIFFKDVLPYL